MKSKHNVEVRFCKVHTLCAKNRLLFEKTVLKWKEIIVRFIAGPNRDDRQVAEINVVGISTLVSAYSYHLAI